MEISTHAKNYLIVKDILSESGFDKYFIDVTLNPNIKVLCSNPEFLRIASVFNPNQFNSNTLTQEVKIATQTTINPTEAVSSVKIFLGKVPSGTVIDPINDFNVSTIEFDSTENPPLNYDSPDLFFNNESVIVKKKRKVIIKKDSMGMAMTVAIIVAIVVIGLLIVFLS